MIIDFHTHLGISMPWVSTDEFNTTGEELITVMDKNKIDKACCCPNPAVAEYYSISNSYIGDMIKKYPDRILGFCRLDPRLILVPTLEESDPAVWEKVMKNPSKDRIENSWVIKEIKRCVRELNFCGIKLHPAVEQFAPENPLFDSIYELAIELDVPIQFHCDRIYHFTSSPQRIIKLAKRFPKLRICAIHLYAGDTVEILSQAENVFLEISEAAKGRLISEAINILGEDRIVFGSDYPFGDPNVIMALLNELNLGDRVLEKIFYKNAINILGK